MPRFAVLTTLALALLVSTSCGLVGPQAAGVPNVPFVATAVDSPEATRLPPSDDVGSAFLQAWERTDYPAMYSLLTPTSQEETPEEVFTLTYRQVVEEATILSVHPRILAAYQPHARAQVVFVTTFQTALFGALQVQNEMTLGFVEGRWGVEWAPALIFPQLSSGTSVRATAKAPARGNIYDRNGLGLAVQAQVVEIGVIPAQIEDEEVVLELLSSVLEEMPADLKARYANVDPSWYVPLGRISAEAGRADYDRLKSIPGVELRAAWIRSYRQEGIAPHIVGVVGPIPREQENQWRAQGYQGDEMVGWMGLERWGEAYLSGKQGGRLEIVTAEGQPVAILAETPAGESSSLYTTFDRRFQERVQDILGQRVGAIAVLEANTGRVLALATYPTFDANLFPVGIDEAQWTSLQGDARHPLVDRATQGIYPPGSVFKIITMAAGMEKGGLAADSTFACEGVWTGLGPDLPRGCWLSSGHGTITLADALTASCDITFYQVALLLNELDPRILPDFARGFGLGAPTGIQVEEEAGLVPDPLWKLQAKGEGWAPGDAVNLAIGQSELLVTPVQVAAMLAAVGNGGTLYRPSVVEMIASDPSRPEWTFAPEAVGRLPVTPQDLVSIQDSLYRATAETQGTAYEAFQGFSIPVSGKTGTAESGQSEPHSWFAGYALAGTPHTENEPEIAIAVIVEHAGRGGEIAAILFRQVVDAYLSAGSAGVPAPVGSR